MNISKIFPKSRKQLIESLEFTSFVYNITIPFQLKSRKTNNPSIKLFFKLVSWWRDWEWEQVKEYNQLLLDSTYWDSRQYYCQRIQKFVSNELTIADFISQVLYPSLSDQKEGHDLLENFQLQASIDLDPKSFGFSTIISNLTPVLEGYDEDPEESFFTEEEFRQIIQNAAIKLEQYLIE